MKVIKETYKMEATILHSLTDEEYKAFKKMSEGQKFGFLKDKDRTISGEEIEPIGKSSKFKLLKPEDMTETERIIASRIADED